METAIIQNGLRSRNHGRHDRLALDDRLGDLRICEMANCLVQVPGELNPLYYRPNDHDPKSEIYAQREKQSAKGEKLAHADRIGGVVDTMRARLSQGGPRPQQGRRSRP